ncbi:hypothetical protein [Sphingopyxis sp. NJF-3]
MTHPKVLAMARQIVADDGNHPPEAVYAGYFDRHAEMRTAIAAIERVTGLAAELGRERADAYTGHNMPDFGEAHTEYADAILALDHLPEPEGGSDEPLP